MQGAGLDFDAGAAVDQRAERTFDRAATGEDTAIHGQDPRIVAPELEGPGEIAAVYRRGEADGQLLGGRAGHSGQH
jgi:hypothetical protein